MYKLMQVRCISQITWHGSKERNAFKSNHKPLLGQGTPTALQLMGIGLDFISNVDA